MTITAKVRKRMIENGRLVHAIVQGESNATTILFRIEGETDLVAEETLFLYLLYKRPNDQTVQLPILLDYTIEDGVILATFTPGAYFTADSGPVEISVIATSSAAELGGSGEVTNTLLWSSFPAWLLVAPSQLADSSTIIEENVFTQYLAELEAESDEAKAYASDAEEFAKGTRSDGQPVTHASDNAKYYKNLAKDWASKTNGTVEGGEMSAKYYAGTADSRAKEAEGYAVGTVSGSPSATFAGKNAKELASDAQDWAKGTRSDGKTPSHTSDSAKAYAESAAASAGIVSDHATAIDAIYADLLNIDVVATDIQDDDSVIDAVAQNIANVNAVAGNESNINAVNSNKTNINTVAGSISNVGTVAGNISNVNAVAGNTANINAVKTNESNINTVAGISSNVTTVAGIASDVTAVAGIASDVSAVEDIKTDVSAVASIDTDVSAVSAIKDDVSAVATIDDDVTTVATDITDVSTVASDITKVTAVADDLTNIDAVADDLTNIDNAEANALKAEGWANGTQNGTPVSSDSPYYENNAKYWADAVPDLKDAIDANSQRIENIEVAVSGSLVQTNTDATMANTKTITNANEILPWALLNRVGARSVSWNQLAINGNFATGDMTGWTDESGGTKSFADNKIIYSWNASYSNNGLSNSASLIANHTYLVVATIKNTYSESRNFRLGQSYGRQTDTFAIPSGSTAIVSGIITPTNASGNSGYKMGMFGTQLGSAYSCEMTNFMVFDLTAMNEASLTADQFQALFPASYYPYTSNPSIIPLNPSAFKVVGKNKIDESTMSRTDMANVASDKWIRWTNKIKYNGAETYYFKCESGFNLSCYSFQVYNYDSNDNIIEPVGIVRYVNPQTGFTFTLDDMPNAVYFRVGFYNATSLSSYTPVGSLFCLNSVTDKTYEAYKETTIDTSDVPEGYVDSSHYNYKENVLVDGVMRGAIHGDVIRKKVMKGTDGGWSYEDHSSDGYYLAYYGNERTEVTLPNYYKPSNNYETPIMAEGANAVSRSNMTALGSIPNVMLQQVPSAYLMFSIPAYMGITSSSAFNSWLSNNNVTIYYRTTEESQTITYTDSIPNIPVEDGTTVQAVTPQTDLVNAIDVPSTIAYMTKIGG